MRRDQVIPGRTSRPRRIAGLAAVLLALGGAGLPGPANAVEIVDTTAIYTFTCVLHLQGVAAPGVGVLTRIDRPTIHQ